MPAQLTPEITVKALLDQHPHLLRVFLERGMLCVGCPTEAFHTLADVAREYQIDENELLESLSKSSRS